MELTDKYIKNLTFEEVDTDELYGDGWFIGGAATGVVVGGVIWAGVALT